MNKKDSKSRQYWILFHFVSLFIFFGLFIPPMSQARMALPEVGINYQTMQVEKPAILKEAGMKEVRTGDKILMRVDEKGVRYFKNLRTNEELAYPPVQPKEKKNQ